VLKKGCPLRQNIRDPAYDTGARDAARVSSSNSLDRGSDRSCYISGVFDSDFLKIVHEYLTVNPQEFFQRARFFEIQVCPGLVKIS
jgi:hypothetical protein